MSDSTVKPSEVLGRWSVEIERGDSCRFVFCVRNMNTREVAQRVRVGTSNRRVLVEILWSMLEATSGWEPK